MERHGEQDAWAVRSLLAGVAEHTPLSMSVEEYGWVYRLARDSEPPFLDIGTHYGLSALVMSRARPGARILTIDNMADFGNDKEGAMREDCGRLVRGEKNVVTIIGESRHLVPIATASHNFGLALIDGSHWASDVAADVDSCRGVPTVLVHDALDEGPARALEGYRHRILPAEKIKAGWDIEPRGLALIEKGEKQ